jgi:hypothetical protein
MNSHIQTRESVRAHSSFPDNKLEALVPPEGNTPTQVSLLPIGVNDVIWGLVYSCGATRAQLVTVACKAARRVTAQKDALELLDTTERCLRGEATEDDIRARQFKSGCYVGAYASALVAGYAAAQAAATAAWFRDYMEFAYEALAAAASSAGYAASDAAPAEVSLAAFKDARDIERQQQIADLVYALESDSCPKTPW